MPERVPRKPSASHDITVPDGAITLAVYHRSADAVDQLQELQAGRVRLEFLQAGTLWTVPTDVTGLLWELSLDDGSQRLVSALIGDRPAVSYSLTRQAGLTELSRALGFRAHVILPCRLEDIEYALGLT